MEEDPPVLMVMGLLASHKVWGETIVNGLVEPLLGYRVILFDNRDTGSDSEKLDRLGRPNLYWKYFLFFIPWVLVLMRHIHLKIWHMMVLHY